MALTEEHDKKIRKSFGKFLVEFGLTDLRQIETAIPLFMDRFSSAPKESDLDLYLSGKDAEEAQAAINADIVSLAEKLGVDESLLRQKLDEVGK